MKKITFLFTLLTVTIGFGQNLLSGGDLEGLATGKIISTSSPWFSGVTNTTQQCSINNNNMVAHNGDQFINMPNDFTWFAQSFTAVTGTEYTLNFWYNFPMGQGQIEDPADGIYVSIRNDADNSQFDPAIGTYLDPTTVAPAVWTQVSINFTAPQANLRLYIQKQARNANTLPPESTINGLLNNSARMDDLSITVTPTASLEDLQKFNFTAYPNPAKDHINLSASKAIDKIEIYSLLGQQVKHVSLNKTQSRVDVSSLSNGIYIVKAFIEDAVGTYKFIKE